MMKRRLATTLSISAAALLFSAASISASAQEKPLPAAKTTDQAAKERTRASIDKAKKQGGRKGVLRFEGEVIEGKVQKPEAFYLLQRTSLSFEGLQLSTDLVPKIVRSLKKPPF